MVKITVKCDKNYKKIQENHKTLANTTKKIKTHLRVNFLIYFIIFFYDGSELGPKHDVDLKY